MNTLLEELQTLIGETVSYDNTTCRIVEVLAEGPALVMQCDHERNIQPNQFGDAQRKVPRSMTVPLRDPTTGGINLLLQSSLTAQQVETINRHLS